MGSVKQPDLFSNGSNVCYHHEESLRMLSSINQVIRGLSSLDELSYICNTLNCSTDTEKTCKDLLKLWDLDLYDVSCKVETLRNLIFGDVLEWNTIEKTLADYSNECIEYGGGAE